MRRLVTWGLVAAVAALGLAAGIDALRGSGEPEPAAAEGEATIPASEPPSSTAPAEPPEDLFAEARARLRAAGVPAGRLTYSDADCRNHDLSLPDLGQAGPPGGYAGRCRYRAVVAGRVETIGSSRSPDWTVRTVCRRGRLFVLADLFGVREPELVARTRGCGAAWKPDGRTVTFVRDGEVRRFVTCAGDSLISPLRCSQPVLTRADLERQLRGARWRSVELGIEEVHWLTRRRFAAILQARSADERQEYLVVFERGRILREPALPYSDLSAIRPSPTGRLAAAYVGGPGGIVVVDRAGEPVRLAMEHGHGIAWSPNDAWIAEATESGIYVFRADEESPEFIEIPVLARDVLWAELP
jgi:hypothetical protein